MELPKRVFIPSPTRPINMIFKEKKNNDLRPRWRKNGVTPAGGIIYVKAGLGRLIVYPANARTRFTLNLYDYRHGGTLHRDGGGMIHNDKYNF